ncbi:MAG: trigger factor, partial [Polyangiaceae bacterium]|nr:trigger factor [Polyangiaceae bacterium]
MQVQVARISPVVIELAVEVPADAVKAQVERAYGTLQKKAHVRGFRPGKAPRDVLARLYGAQVANDVVNAIVSDTLPKALSEQQVQPLNQPQVEAGKFAQGEAFSYKARFEVQPDIVDVTYEGFDLQRPGEMATDAAVTEQLELLRRQHAQLRSPEPARPAQKGDVLTINFTLAVDGQDVKDAGAEGIQVELGASQLLPELDAGLAGTAPDAEVDIDAQLPPGHPRPELAGKKAHFHVHVKDVKERVQPALDDEFAKYVGTYTTQVKLRSDIHTRREKIIKERDEAALDEQ